MSFTYAIADLHGRFDLLDRALDQILAREPGTIITLGDYVDRGPQSRQVIERLMRGVEAPWKMINLKGNHEDIMLGTCMARYQPSFWLANGGYATLRSYGQQRNDPLNVLLVPDAHLKWIANLPLTHMDAHRVYVHAGIAVDDIPIEQQKEETVTWMIYSRDDHGGAYGRHVVHGHHYHDNVVRMRERTALDTNAWYSGKLVVGAFDDDKPGGPVDFIQIDGEPGKTEML